MCTSECSAERWGDPAYLADLNGGFIITERSQDDLLLTFDFGGGAASSLTLDGFFAKNSGPGFGSATPDGILDDEAAVPILSALFSGGANAASIPPV